MTMREGLLPATATHVMGIDADERTALRLGHLLGEMLDPEEHAVATFEVVDGKVWRTEVFFGHPPREQAIRDLVAVLIPGSEGARLAQAARFDAVQPKNWIAAALDGLKPVRAGRFVVHGGHDRGTARLHEIGIEIEAALAFGTGHHGTTHGCLAMIADLLKQRRPLRAIDVGTGTGVLAIALALATHRRVVLSDIDPVSVAVTAENARLNRAGAYLRPITAPGLRHPALAGNRRYDLLIANILAGPLRRMAKDFAPAVAGGGAILLSGLLIRDVPGVLSAYAGHGFRLVKKTEREGWATLLLRRGGAAPRASR
jgi:ribosomal protein L11 methyltransferase